ncbi:uncharacterized protein KD926_010845 [Aspergillus affinis]|uniref:uncharacterized protein n=1 Tax=Aspergillus affinis TaxID=1070780 RepID=UPI0022FE5E6C|nr:uncharacterized protein KD926_010845 [Aspergillus affinis]KAI9038426.1 hypothetical protein KD926_010845 [Aspergillus affinis]
MVLAYHITEREWDRLKRDEDRLSSEIEQAEEQIEQLFAKLKRLRKHRNFLKERGGKMLDHNSYIMDVLDGEDPPSAEDLRELDRLASEHETAQLAAVSSDPTLSQLMNDPAFWSVFDLSAAGGTVEPTGGTPSGSR